ncbi:MAG: tRNA epoxyqueuosine(34) reductase QueG [Reyranellaceae bacterium]
MKRPPTPDRIKAAIAERARAEGFDCVGFAPPAPSRRERELLGIYLREGRHGDMQWMEETAARRGDPLVLWPQVKTVVALGLNYGPDRDPLGILQQRERAAISVYAQGRDYHDVVKKKLKAVGGWIHRQFASELKVFVDTAPVMEKPLAQRAGLGWQGKHTNLVSREFGSWLFLGEIYLSLELPPDAAEIDHCGSCRACLDICPTAAFPAPYQLDARRCISYLTIEHKGPIPSEFRAALGNRIYGCDDCLAVCPWNKFAQAGREALLAAPAERSAPALAELAALDDAAFREKFRGSPVKRIGRDRFLRNVAIALGNATDAVSRTAIDGLLQDASPLVRGAAVWALKQKSIDEFTQRRSQALAQETDPSVIAEWN